MESKKEANKFNPLHKEWIREVVLDALDDNKLAINNKLKNETIIAQIQSIQRLHLDKARNMTVVQSSTNNTSDKTSPDKDIPTAQDDTSKSKAPTHRMEVL